MTEFNFKTLARVLSFATLWIIVSAVYLFNQGYTPAGVIVSVLAVIILSAGRVFDRIREYQI